MKIFIAGAKAIHRLDDEVIQRLNSIFQKGYDVLVGDCDGVDSSVQKYYADLHYTKVTVYASNGIARNNIGHWNVKAIDVSPTLTGFDFYKQKDIAMAHDADYGFMIWDGQSKGTLNNIVNLLFLDKKVLVYLAPYKKMASIKSFDDMDRLVGLCNQKVKSNYYFFTQQPLLLSTAPD